MNVQKIKDIMAALNKPKANDLFQDSLIPDGEGDQMVDKEAFLKRLKIDMLYKEDEASAVGNAILSEKDPSKVSMKKLEELLSKPMTAPVKEPLSLDKS